MFYFKLKSFESRSYLTVFYDLDEQRRRNYYAQITVKLAKYYKQPSPSFYRELIKVMYGPNHNWKVRRFHLSGGCSVRITI